jgi:hypothetical protein
MVPNEYNLKQVSMLYTGSFLLLPVACGPHVHAATTVFDAFLQAVSHVSHQKEVIFMLLCL